MKKVLSIIRKTIGHFMTITKHKVVVMKHCFKCGLYWQGITHDLSKYSPTEFVPGVKYYQGFRSPNAAQKEAEGLSTAWLHHKGRNKHHLEYWIDYPLKKDVKLAGMKMPTKYVVEMFCDRVAACKIYNGDKYTDKDPLDYFNNHRNFYTMHIDTETLLYKLLYMLSAQGEEYTFKFIRIVVLKNDSTYKIDEESSLRKLVKKIDKDNKIKEFLMKFDKSDKED